MPNKRVSDYDLLLQINSAVARIESRYDKKFEDIENDISALRDFQNKALGVLAIASMVFSLAINWVWKKVTES